MDRGRRLPSARGLAATVVRRVLEDGAFAAAALDAELARAVQLSPRDRGLATELVYGTLRALPWLEDELGRASERGIAKLDSVTRCTLLVGAYQLFFLARVPAFAAVNEAVRSLRANRGARVAGFANAVLRKLARRAETLGDEERADHLCRSVPSWLTLRLERALGADGARAFLMDTHRAPETVLRVEEPSERGACLERLRHEFPEGALEEGRWSPRAIRCKGVGRLEGHDDLRKGAWTLQEEGSQVVALALGAHAGDIVLDACAGRGHKTGILARSVAPTGRVDAADLHPKKLAVLNEELSRLRLTVGKSFAVNWCVGVGDVEGGYDRILLDAPCSGTGTLRRRPEILVRLEEGRIREIVETQKAMIRRVAPLLRPGGTLVYAVCSVLREEGEDVVAEVLRELTWLEPASFEAEPLRSLAGERHELRLLPHVHGTDGYFIAAVRRRESDAQRPRIAL